MQDGDGEVGVAPSGGGGGGDIGKPWRQMLRDHTSEGALLVRVSLACATTGMRATEAAGEGSRFQQRGLR